MQREYTRLQYANQTLLQEKQQLQSSLDSNQAALDRVKREQEVAAHSLSKQEQGQHVNVITSLKYRVQELEDERSSQRLLLDNMKAQYETFQRQNEELKQLLEQSHLQAIQEAPEPSAKRVLQIDSDIKQLKAVQSRVDRTSLDEARTRLEADCAWVDDEKVRLAAAQELVYSEKRSLEDEANSTCYD